MGRVVAVIRANPRESACYSAVPHNREPTTENRAATRNSPRRNGCSTLFKHAEVVVKEPLLVYLEGDFVPGVGAGGRPDRPA